ncbi:MAG: beta-glucosidase [Candidatus Sulfotelmatobacter sp.]
MNSRFMERAALGAAVVLCLLTGSLSQGQFGPVKHEAKGSWENKILSPDERADLVIDKMTLDEKIQLLHGLGWETLFGPPPESGPGTRAIRPSGFIPGIPRLGIPDLQMTDASMGVAGGGDKSRYATALPSTVAMAASWDSALSYETGTLIGSEVRAQGFNMSLGSGINLTREPRDGRTFEYMGEDPFLAGTLAGQILKAIKAQHVITDVKHYVVNDQEAGRFFVNSVIDKRSMRESDLLAFEIALRESNPGAVMCAYNKINGVYACEDDYTLNDVLKKELGFKGFVISDWGGTHSTTKAVLAGLDAEMPGYSFLGEPLKKAVESGEVPMARLNDMVHRILRTEFDSGIVDNPPQAHVVDVLRGFEVAQKIEEKGAVLLKNEHAQLPLNAAGIKTIAIIGGHADTGVMSGGGSGQVSPAGGSAVPPSPDRAPGDPLGIFSITSYHRSAPLKGIAERAKGAVVKFDPGTNPVSAATLAKASDVAIIFAVQHTCENMDVPNLALPENQDALIEAVAAANSHTIVVLETGGPVTMPWIDKVSAIIEAWYPGIRGSEALANILFGDVNPSGKLPVTFARTEADLPHPKHVDQPAVEPNHPIPPLQNLPIVPGISTNQTPFDAVYDEGLKVGYKCYDAEKKEPLFPFGFGLSYTTYSYSELKTRSGNGLSVTFKVKNTGNRAGEETAQVYLTLPASTQEPPTRLVGWSKIALGPGEQKDVTVNVNPQMLSIFNLDKNSWAIVPGEYKVWVGRSSRDLPLNATIAVGSEVAHAAEIGAQR